MFCRMEGQTAARLNPEAARIGHQFPRTGGPALGFQHVHKGLEQKRFDREQLLRPTLSTSSMMLAQSGRSFTGSPAAMRRSKVALALAPQQDVVVVQIAHRVHPSTMPISGAAGFFIPTIW